MDLSDKPNTKTPEFYAEEFFGSTCHCSVDNGTSNCQYCRLVEQFQKQHDAIHEEYRIRFTHLERRAKCSDEETVNSYSRMVAGVKELIGVMCGHCQYNALRISKFRRAIQEGMSW